MSSARFAFNEAVTFNLRPTIEDGRGPHLLLRLLASTRDAGEQQAVNETVRPTSSETLVVFDTNVLERRYLSALLRGETCKDFDVTRSSGFVPAVHVHSFYEICHHAKLEKKKFPWMDKCLGYPGGIDRAKTILRELPDCDVDNNVYWWFGLCEEWRGLDWDEEFARVDQRVRPDRREAARREVCVRRSFCEWKFALSAFCERVWDVLERELYIVTDDAVTREDASHPFDRAFQVEQSIALRSLIPSEDLRIVSRTLLANARALVSEDKEVLQFGGLTLSLNYKTAFVHPDQLREAIKLGFAFRWTREQTSSRQGNDAT